MHPRYELTGQVFGRLTVLAFHSVGKDYATLWLCRCECGNEKIVIGKNLTAGRTRSCGCKQGGRSDAAQAGFLQRGKFGSVSRSHGLTASPLYTTWVNVRQRCTNPSDPDYRNYGGRGIKICDEWQDFEVFYRDMLPTWQPGLTIDRIDTNGNYEPGNCHWVPNSEQWKTRRSHGPKRADGSPSKPYRRSSDGAPKRK